MSAPQYGSPGQSRPADTPGGSFDKDDRDELSRNQEILEKFRLGREKERQKRIVDDANRLVELTSQYQKSLSAHRAPTDDDQKLLLQIEKLAREVKDRMRGM